MLFQYGDNLALILPCLVAVGGVFGQVAAPSMEDSLCYFVTCGKEGSCHNSIPRDGWLMKNYGV